MLITIIAVSTLFFALSLCAMVVFSDGSFFLNTPVEEELTSFEIEADCELVDILYECDLYDIVFQAECVLIDMRIDALMRVSERNEVEAEIFEQIVAYDVDAEIAAALECEVPGIPEPDAFHVDPFCGTVLCMDEPVSLDEPIYADHATQENFTRITECKPAPRIVVWDTIEMTAPFADIDTIDDDDLFNIEQGVFLSLPSVFDPTNEDDLNRLLGTN